jgi:hypothetical protein
MGSYDALSVAGEVASAAVPAAGVVASVAVGSAAAIVATCFSSNFLATFLVRFAAILFTLTVAFFLTAL